VEILIFFTGQLKLLIFKHSRQLFVQTQYNQNGLSLQTPIIPFVYSIYNPPFNNPVFITKNLSFFTFFLSSFLPLPSRFQWLSLDRYFKA